MKSLNIFRLPRFSAVTCVAALSLLSEISVTASPLTLTAAGISDGFSLSLFASGFGNPSGCCGPLGLAVTSNGNVVVDASNLSANYVFQDVDGQTLSSAISHTAFNAFPPALATADGALWGSGGFNGPNAGKLIKLNNDGTINTVYNLPGLSITNGMWTNPVNGHIIASGSSIYDIDVSGATPTFRVVNGGGADGLTVSPDGTIVYTSTVAGYNLSTGALVFGPVFVAGGADGMGVIASNNSLNGDLVVNTNSGTVVLIDPITKTQTIIASGGTRGDYTSADPTNGTLFLTQSDDIFRLSCGAGCGIGGAPPPTSGTPEPSTFALLGLPLAGLLFGMKKSIISRRAKR